LIILSLISVEKSEAGFNPEVVDLQSFLHLYFFLFVITSEWIIQHETFITVTVSNKI